MAAARGRDTWPKKQSILTAPFLAAAAATETHGLKIAAGYFLLLCNKNNLFLWPWPEDWPHGRKNSLRFAATIFYCSAIKNNLFLWPRLEDWPDGRKNSLRLFFIV